MALFISSTSHMSDWPKHIFCTVSLPKSFLMKSKWLVLVFFPSTLLAPAQRCFLRVSLSVYKVRKLRAVSAALTNPHLFTMRIEAGRESLRRKRGWKLWRKGANSCKYCNCPALQYIIQAECCVHGVPSEVPVTTECCVLLGNQRPLLSTLGPIGNSCGG